MEQYDLSLVYSVAERLRKLGYYRGPLAGPEFQSALEKALKSYQHRYSLPVTGKLDDVTLSELRLKRCTAADVGTCDHKVAKYVASGCKWNKKTLTYGWVNFWRGSLTEAEIRSVFRSACDAWEAVCGIKFVEIDDVSRADVDVGFASEDGVGGTLAWAYLPGSCGGSLAGRLRFDSGENWALPGNRGQNIWQTAVHELGHILGFYHSNSQNSIMWPYSNGGGDRISADDAAGAVALYGPPEDKTPADPSTPEPLVFQAQLTSSLADKGNKYYRLDLSNYNAKPKKVSVKVSSKADVDFDLYVSKNATPNVVGVLDESDEYLYGSYAPGANEGIEFAVDKDAEYYDILVQSFSGSGQFSLIVKPEF